MSKRRMWVTRCVVLALAITAAVLVRWVWFPGRAFDAIAWRDEIQIRDGVRLGMADRLIARGELLGMTRAQIVERLGEPPETGYFSDWDLVYWLGPERNYLFGIDSEWLVLRLGDGGRVEEQRIVRD